MARCASRMSHRTCSSCRPMSALGRIVDALDRDQIGLGESVVTHVLLLVCEWPDAPRGCHTAHARAVVRCQLLAESWMRWIAIRSDWVNPSSHTYYYWCVNGPMRLEDVTPHMLELSSDVSSWQNRGCVGSRSDRTG